MCNRKRVGTITLGVSLILLGVVLISSLFVGYTTVFNMLRLTPIVLVLLGIEILVFTFSTKSEEKLKYDGVSIFLIFLFLFISLIFAAVGWWGSYFNEVVDTAEFREFLDNMFRYHTLH